MSFLNGQQTSNLGLMVPRPSLGATGMNGQIQQGHYRSSDDGLVIKQFYCMEAISVNVE